MKYKELDAAKSVDEFKVGDKFNAYEYDAPFKNREVTDLDGNIIISVSHRYHFKQCRKLEEVKPREWWIGPGVYVNGGDRFSYMDAIDYDPKPTKYRTADGTPWIKVQEVIE